MTTAGADAGEIRLVNGERLALMPEFARAEPLRDDWEGPVYRLFRDALAPGMVVFDIGASFGLYAIGAARAVGPDGRVFAFEAAHRTAEALRRHVGWNGVADRVEVVEAAVSDRPGRERFWEHETSFLASRVEASPRREEARFPTPVRPRTVTALTLDDFCRTRRVEPAVVKVDVEGGEAAVLRGARGLLRRRVPAVFFLEVHEALLESAGLAADHVFAELAAARWTWSEIHAEPAGTRHYLCRPTA